MITRMFDQSSVSWYNCVRSLTTSRNRLNLTLLYVSQYPHIFLYFKQFLPHRAVGVLFSPMVSGWVGGRREIVCPGYISETVRCRKLILGRNIG